jgi:hypothetical protein
MNINMFLKCNRLWVLMDTVRAALSKPNTHSVLCVVSLVTAAVSVALLILSTPFMLIKVNPTLKIFLFSRLC